MNQSPQQPPHNGQHPYYYGYQQAPPPMPPPPYPQGHPAYPSAPQPSPAQHPPSEPQAGYYPGEEPIPKRIAAMEVHKHLHTQFISALASIGAVFVVGILARLNIVAMTVGILLGAGYFIWVVAKVKREMQRLEQTYRINPKAGLR